MTNQLDYLGPILRQLFWGTFKHPVVGQYVEWVPVSWLAAMMNPEADDRTDLGTWAPEAELVTLDKLYADMLVRGMRDPFIVGVGRNDRRVRLEAGNHRVQVLQQKGVLVAPAVAYVGDTAITHVGNGSHSGKLLPLKLPLVPEAYQIMGPYPIKEYMRLSEALVRMPPLPGVVPSLS